MNPLLQILGVTLVLGGGGRLALWWLGESSRFALQVKRLPAPPQQANRFRKGLFVGTLAMGAVAAGFSRGMVFGVAGLVCLPLVLAVRGGIRAHRLRGAYEDSALVYFHGLRGLIHSGLGLPAALFQLASAQPTFFSQAMARSLAGFDRGQALGECLDRLGRRFPSPLVVSALKSLQMAYGQGLAVLPILDRVVPLLEKEQRRLQRSADLRRSTQVQAAFAFCLPWVLSFALGIFQPEVWQRRWEDPQTLRLIFAVLSTEALGLWCLRRVSVFC